MGAELPMLPMLLPITSDPRSRATSAAAGAGSSEYMGAWNVFLPMKAHVQQPEETVSRARAETLTGF